MISTLQRWTLHRQQHNILATIRILLLVMTYSRVCSKQQSRTTEGTTNTTWTILPRIWSTLGSLHSPIHHYQWQNRHIMINRSITRIIFQLNKRTSRSINNQHSTLLLQQTSTAMKTEGARNLLTTIKVLLLLLYWSYQLEVYEHSIPIGLFQSSNNENNLRLSIKYKIVWNTATYKLSDSSELGVLDRKSVV